MATLNNAPFGKFGTCVPGGAAIPKLEQVYEIIYREIDGYDVALSSITGRYGFSWSMHSSFFQREITNKRTIADRAIVDIKAATWVNDFITPTSNTAFPWIAEWLFFPRAIGSLKFCILESPTEEIFSISNGELRYMSNLVIGVALAQQWQHFVILREVNGTLKAIHNGTLIWTSAAGELPFIRKITTAKGSSSLFDYSMGWTRFGRGQVSARPEDLHEIAEAHLKQFGESF